MGIVGLGSHGMGHMTRRYGKPGLSQEVGIPSVLGWTVEAS
jgi:hypothetical protein